MSSQEEEARWRTKFAKGLLEVMGEETARQVLPQTASLGDGASTISEREDWTLGVIRRLLDVGDEERAREVLMGCSHIMPEERVSVLRDFHSHHRDLDELMEFWQSQFIYHLKKGKGLLKASWLEVILDQGWGEVGVRNGPDIIATKIPRDVKGFFEASGYADRAFRYCHCDRIRSMFLADHINLPHQYCYCAAGFYRSNWERVLGKTVVVTLESSLLKGDPVCQFRIRLLDDSEL